MYFFFFSKVHMPGFEESHETFVEVFFYITLVMEPLFRKIPFSFGHSSNKNVP